jgi:hypothetical protein
MAAYAEHEVGGAVRAADACRRIRHDHRRAHGAAELGVRAADLVLRTAADASLVERGARGGEEPAVEGRRLISG